MFKAKFWNDPITWKGYAKLCGIAYAIFVAIYAAFFGYTYREDIADWFHDRIMKKKETAYETSVFEEDDNEE